MSFFRKVLRFLRLAKASLSRPIFRRSKEPCQLHQWTTINQLLEDDDNNRLKHLCEKEEIPPLQSLFHGTPVCRKCGYIANHNLNINIENLIFNLRALDT